MPQFTVVDMGEDQFEAAYPLVRWIAHGVCLDRWLYYAREARRKGGLLGLTVDGGALFGLLVHRKEKSLRHGCVLCIDHCVTFELNRAAPGRRALCEAAEALALELSCSALEYRLGSRGYADAGSVKAHGWVSLGHSLESIVFTKTLHATASSVDGRLLAAADQR